MSKDETAKKLAEAHYRLDSALTDVFRLQGSAEAESQPDEPIKLLEVNEATIPAGILPLEFGAHPASGIEYSSIIVEVTPDEFRAITSGQLPLPDGWKITGEPYPRPEGVESLGA